MDQISLARLQDVNPVLSARVIAYEKALGFAIRVTMGLRSQAEQTAIWSQGRLALATVNTFRQKVGMPPITQAENIIVTKAPPCHSWHEYGLAVDVVPMDPVPDWNLDHPVWKKIVYTTKDFKLTDGISWKDEPHLQPIELPLSPTPQYINILMTSGPQATWATANLVETA